MAFINNQRWFIVGFLILTGILCYRDSFSGAFLFDDYAFILENPRVHSFVPVWNPLLDTTRPFAHLVFALNYALCGEKVFGYHLINVAIHITAALVLFGLIWRTLMLSSMPKRSALSAQAVALAASLIWMVHPLQTESVTYIFQRCESLAGLLYLLTLYGFLRFKTSSEKSSRWLTLSVVSCWLGMMTKETMVTAPIVGLVYERVFFKTDWKEIGRRLGRFFAALFSSWSVLGIIYFFNGPWIQEHFARLKPVSSFDYAFTQFQVIAHYLKMSFWPSPLVFDYDWPVVSHVSNVIFPAGIIGILIGLSIWQLRQRPGLGFLGLTFFLILAPTSSVLRLSDVASEHRIYLSLACVIILCVIGFEALLAKLIVSESLRRRVAALVLIGIVGSLGFQTWQRNADYRSPFLIWSGVVKHAPHNARGHLNLGLTIVKEKRDLEQAMESFEKALALNPDYAEARNNLGNALYLKQDYEGARVQLVKALELYKKTSDKAFVESNLAGVLLKQQKLDAAILHYKNALSFNPNLAPAHNDLGTALRIRGDVAGAKFHYQEAIRLSPDFAIAHNNLGKLLAEEGHMSEAIDHFATAVKLNGGFEAAKTNLAVALSHSAHGEK